MKFLIAKKKILNLTQINLKIMSKSKNQNSKINIEIDENTAHGTYSNLAIINHSVSEFVIDFISIMPGQKKNQVKSRIIITPQHAKNYLMH